MTLTLSPAEARRFLAAYHFTPTTVPGVFDRLGTVQYDPLNPVGRNPDLVFQARVPGYQVDDWQQTAYTDRLVYDAWDKQACLVPVSDWPMRARLRARTVTWTPLLLEEQTEAVAAALAELDARGPLSSLEFEDQSHFTDRSAWYGPKRIKHILRALWDRGLIVTHHRQGGRHYYDRAERVIPPEHFNAPPLLDEAAYTRWAIARRAQSMGLIRPVGEYAIWFGCGPTARRAPTFKELVEIGTLTPVEVRENGSKAWPAYLPTSALPLLEAPAPAPRAIFIAPLDSLIWDRKAVLQLYNFSYKWEVYVPEAQRRWGYYVLPVFYGDRFVARLDSRLEGPRERPTGARMAEPGSGPRAVGENAGAGRPQGPLPVGEAKRQRRASEAQPSENAEAQPRQAALAKPSPQGRGVWTVSRWWWEPDITPTPDLLDALHVAAENFARYLHARSVRVAEGVAPEIRQAFTID